MNVKEAGKVYSLLGASAKLRIMFRPGGHHGFDDVSTYEPLLPSTHIHTLGPLEEKKGCVCGGGGGANAFNHCKLVGHCHGQSL